MRGVVFLTRPSRTEVSLSSGKPTHDALEFALIKMRRLVEAYGVKKVAMPKIVMGY